MDLQKCLSLSHDTLRQILGGRIVVFHSLVKRVRPEYKDKEKKGREEIYLSFRYSLITPCID